MAGSPQPDELGLALVVTIRTCLRELLLYERRPAELSSTASSNHSRSGKSRSGILLVGQRNRRFDTHRFNSFEPNLLLSSTFVNLTR
ncbi:hypothetical protein CN105_02010 [Sinorhizobium meliloti]|nr:hypothetical protein CN105_02010 [Sinorhizobium meliloti]